jgi:hypothetical protein
MDHVALHAIDVGILVTVGLTGYVGYVCLRRQCYQRALSALLLGAYIISLLDATKGHIRYAHHKRNVLSKDAPMCASPRDRSDEAITAQAEDRISRCADVDLLYGKSFVELVCHSIHQKGWIEFILRHEPTTGVSWLANSHVGFYWASTWFAGLAVLMLLVFIWIRDRTRGILAKPYTPPPSSLHEQSWLTSLHLSNPHVTKLCKDKPE